MEVEYKRDVNSSYLILHCEREQDTAGYQMRMLMGNVIPALMKCTVKGLDGRTLFYYDITCKQSISALYEKQKMNYEDLRLLLEGVAMGMQQMEEHLMAPEDLVLLPEYMYLDMERRRLSFCYLPGYGQEIWEQFRRFTEFFLPRVDHQDNRAVSLGYGIYRVAAEKGAYLDAVKAELYKAREEKENASETGPMGIKEADARKEQEEALRQEALAAFFQDEPEEEQGERNQKWAAAGVAGLAAAVSFLGVFYFVNWQAAIVTALVTAGVTGGIGYRILSRTGSHEAQEREEKQEPIWTEEEERERENPRSAEKNNVTTVLYQSGQPALSSFVSKIPGKFPTISLEKDILIIGTLPEAADAILESPAVSRVHARVCSREGNYYLTDLNSRNGTCVNGRILQGEEEYCLKNYDEVSFADVPYIFIQ